MVVVSSAGHEFLYLLGTTDNERELLWTTLENWTVTTLEK